MRQCQEMVSELTAVYKEHNFVHEIDRYQKQTLLSISFLFFFAVVGLSLWKENRNVLPGSRLRIG